MPEFRLSQLIEIATLTFIQSGYRRTQMADIAEALGVAKGTLYGYVESKEALFDAAVRYADRLGDVPKPDQLPVRTPESGAAVHYVTRRLTDQSQEMVIVRVLQGALTITDPAGELRAVLDDLFLRLGRNRFAIKLVDRCAAEYPELAAAWFGGGRGAQHQLLAQLLELRTREGRYRACADVAVVARTLLETVAFWALHRHFDPAPQPIDDAKAQRVVVEMLVRSVAEVQP